MFRNNIIHLKVTFHTKQVPTAHSPLLPIPSPLNPLVNPPPVFPPQQLFNLRPPVIPLPIPVIPSPSERNNLPTRTKHSTTKHCPTTSNPPSTVSYRTETPPPQTMTLIPNLRSFPQNNHPNVHQATTNATVFNNVSPNLTPSTANPAISHPIWQLNAPHNPNSNHAATCSIPVKPFSTTTNIAPPFVTPVIHPTYGFTAPIPL